MIRGNGILTGYSKIDAEIGSMLPGQLIVLAGAPGEGKSWLATNIAVNAAFGQHKNVVIITGEMPRKEYLYRLCVCHSNNPKFERPLEYVKVKDHSLSDVDKELYEKVVLDFTSDDNGYVKVVSIVNTKVSDLMLNLEKINKVMSVDLVIIDYFSLLKPSVICNFENKNALFSELIRELKSLAVKFNNGKGIPVVILYQVSNKARDVVKFEPGKYYTLSSLADSSEAGKSADVAMALLRTEEMQEAHELGFGILKSVKSGKSKKLFKLDEHFDTAYIGNFDN